MAYRRWTKTVETNRMDLALVTNNPFPVAFGIYFFI